MNTTTNNSAAAVLVAFNAAKEAARPNLNKSIRDISPTQVLGQAIEDAGYPQLKDAFIDWSDEQSAGEPGVATLALGFAIVLEEWLQPHEWAAMRVQNRDGYGGVCASHNFCDANMAMEEAFNRVFDGDGYTCSTEDSKLWVDAWTYAKTHFLTAPTDGGTTATVDKGPTDLDEVVELLTDMVGGGTGDSVDLYDVLQWMADTLDALATARREDAKTELSYPDYWLQTLVIGNLVDASEAIRKASDSIACAMAQENCDDPSEYVTTARGLADVRAFLVAEGKKTMDATHVSYLAELLMAVDDAVTDNGCGNPDHTGESIDECEECYFAAHRRIAQENDTDETR